MTTEPLCVTGDGNAMNMRDIEDHLDWLENHGVNLTMSNPVIDAAIKAASAKQEAFSRAMTWAATLRDEAQGLRHRASLERLRGAPEAAAGLEAMAGQCERDAAGWELEDAEGSR